MISLQELETTQIYTEKHEMVVDMGSRVSDAELQSAIFNQGSINFIALAKTNILNVSMFGSSDAATSEYSLEFDRDIDGICIDPSGCCIIVSDMGGYLHFVSITTDNCGLIFTHKIPSEDGEFVHVFDTIMCRCILAYSKFLFHRVDSCFYEVFHWINCFFFWVASIGWIAIQWIHLLCKFTCCYCL